MTFNEGSQNGYLLFFINRWGSAREREVVLHPLHEFPSIWEQ